MMHAPRTLLHLLRERAGELDDRRAYTFLADGERAAASLSYAQLERRARAIAAMLQDRGIGPGERALLVYPPGLDFVCAFFGCLYAGVVAVPAYPPHPAQLARGVPRLVAVAADATPRVVLCTSDVAALAPGVASLAPSVASLPWIATDLLVGDAASAWREPAIGPDALVFLQYTSGSTASPRGVMVSHANLLHNLSYGHHVEENDATSISLSWLPVIHDMGLIEGVLLPLYGGYPACLMSPAAFLQRPVRWLRAITRLGATNSGAPNFAYDLCVRKIGAADRATLDLSSWRVAYDGAEPIRRDTLRAFHDAFAPCGFRWSAFYPVYGLAEATLVVTSGRRSYEPVFADVDADRLGRGAVCAPNGARSRTIVSCGPHSCRTRIVIADQETGTALGECQVGEVWVASPSVAQGYWNRPEESAHTFRAYLPDGDGPFLRTGDLGYLDGGELYIVGRLKDVLVVRGFKHYPQDVELTVERQHPAVRAGCCAAFAVEDASHEARVVVVAEIDPRRHADCDAIVSAIRLAIAEEHGIQLHAVSLIALGAMPKTTSGKLRRSACREAFVSGGLHELQRWTGDARPTRPRAPAVVMEHA